MVYLLMGLTGFDGSLTSYMQGSQSLLDLKV